jgi:Ca2+-binding EF-hand superfamily protein
MAYPDFTGLNLSVFVLPDELPAGRIRPVGRQFWRIFMNDLGQRVVKGLFIVVAGCLLGLDAQAGAGHGHGPAAFADFDVNNDGSISENEFNTVREQRMKAMSAEGRKMPCAASAPAFADLDTDRNGQVSAEELSAGQKGHMEKCREMRQKEGGGMGMGGHHHKPQFSEFDTDGNGVISEQEFNDAHAKRMSAMAAQGHTMKHAGNMPTFASIDTNGDGGISEQEFDAHLAARRAQMEQMHQQSQKQE